MRIIKSLLAIGLCLALAGPALAQPGGGQGMGGPGMGPGMGPGRGMGKMYNPQTVTTIRGTVESPGPQRPPHAARVPDYQDRPGQHHGSPGTHRLYEPATDSLNPGDAVEVTGSKVEMGGKTMMMAKEVKVGGKTFQLRDDQGMPLWRGQGRPQPQ